MWECCRGADVFAAEDLPTQPSLGRVVHVRAENAQNAARNRDANAQKAGEMWRDDQ